MGAAKDSVAVVTVGVGKVEVGDEEVGGGVMEEVVKAEGAGVETVAEVRAEVAAAMVVVEEESKLGSLLYSPLRRMAGSGAGMGVEVAVASEVEAIVEGAVEAGVEGAAETAHTLDRAGPHTYLWTIQ